MGKIVKLLTFIILTPLTLFLALIYLFYLSYGLDAKDRSLSRFTQPVAFAALPAQENVLNDKIVVIDKRIENTRMFLDKYDSPLEPYAEYIVKISEKYQLDYRLLPAIAMQESNLCKKAPKGSYNCWGFGIYGKKMTRFPSYEEAIETVAKTLFIEYKSKGLITPEQIMSKYTPSNNGAWADSVSLFMDRLE